jgi:hypothetical protein
MGGERSDSGAGPERDAGAGRAHASSVRRRLHGDQSCRGKVEWVPDAPFRARYFSRRTLFGLVAVAAMLAFYVLEDQGAWFAAAGSRRSAFPAHDVNGYGRVGRHSNVGMLPHVASNGLNLSFSRVAPHNDVNRAAGSNQRSNTFAQPRDGFLGSHLIPSKRIASPDPMIKFCRTCRENQEDPCTVYHSV